MAAAPITLSAAQRQTALKALEAAETHGLARRPPPEKTDDASIVAALIRYAREVRTGRLELGDFPKNWGVRPAPFDPRPGLSAALAVDRLDAWLESLAPPYPGYKGLRRGLAEYRQLAAKGGWKALAEGAPLKFGAQGPEVVALRERLAAEFGGEAQGGAAFDEALRQRVMQAQRHYGLEPDGVVGPTTRRMLNEPVGQRILQIIANMERWRWLPPKLPPTRVQVNSGAAIVTLFRDDRPVLSMKAVAGRPGDETPMLVSNIHSIVLNPPWNVPSSIANNELWPKERANPGYFQRNHIRVIKTEEGSRLQQAAGDMSALGRFKFDFDNPYAVYLHDTPAQEGFSRYARQVSHGCVRLEKPEALANALLNDDPQWSAQAIADTVASGETVRARVPTETPVYILYWTAFAGADGRMNFRRDTYDWDRDLLQRIGVLDVKPEGVAA